MCSSWNEFGQVLLRRLSDVSTWNALYRVYWVFHVEQGIYR